MKVLVFAFLLLPFAFPAAAQSDLAFKRPDPQIKTTYDEFRNVTTIETPWIALSPKVGCRDGLGLRASYSFDGEKIRPGKGTFIISFECRDNDWMLLKSRDAIFLAGPNRINLTGGSRSSDTTTFGGRLATWEMLFFAVSIGDLNTIASEKDVRLRVGFMESPLTDQDRRWLADLIAAARR